MTMTQPKEHTQEDYAYVIESELPPKEASWENVESLWLTNVSWSNLKALGPFHSLRKLAIVECPDIATLVGIDQVTQLQELVLVSCEKLVGLEGVEALTGLLTLTIQGCPALTGLDALRACPTLTSLSCTDCPTLTNARSIGRLKGLHYLDLRDTGLPSRWQQLRASEAEVKRFQRSLSR